MNFLLPGHPGGGLHPPSWPEGLPASFWRLLSAPQQTSSPVLSDLRTLISERFLKPPSPTQSKTLAGDARALSSHLGRVDFGVSGRGRAASSGPLRGSPNGCQINPWGGFWPGPGSFLCPNLSSVLLTSEKDKQNMWRPRGSLYRCSEEVVVWMDCLPPSLRGPGDGPGRAGFQVLLSSKHMGIPFESLSQMNMLTTGRDGREKLSGSGVSALGSLQKSPSPGPCRLTHRRLAGRGC